MTNLLCKKKDGVRAMAGVILAGIVLSAGCSFAPKYEKPAVVTPAAYKEPGTEPAAWKTAEPQDNAIRGQWWEMFGQPELNALEEQVTVTNNQTLAEALANFLSARAVVKQTQSAYFPTVSVSPSVTRSRSATVRSQPGTSTTGPNISTLYSLPFDASWELDFWGSIRNSVKANALEARATLADLENTRLTVQSELAVDYFQLRGVDAQKKLLDETASAYQDSVNLTHVLYSTGIASDQDVAQAQTQLSTTLAQATDLGIQRAQLEHAIATLLGRPAPGFTLSTNPMTAKPVPIPFGVPSQLLERRPDIAAAERRVAEANAQIGVARAAYFPTITLSGDVGYQGQNLGSLISGPGLFWSVGATAAETLFDAGRRQAVTEQAWANYQGKVAAYRLTVLNAFQDVEDNLAALRVLERELKEQDDAVAASQNYLALAKDRYRLGIDSYLNVITAQTTLLSSQRSQINLQTEQMTASVQLIIGLGGSWDGSLTATTVKR